MPAVAKPETDTHLEWVARVPMVGDRFFTGDILRWVVLTGLVVSAIVAGISIAVDSPRMLPLLLKAVWIVVGALFVASHLIALVFFRNHYYVHYRLDPKAAHYSLARDAKAMSGALATAGMGLGVLRLSPLPAGAGLLARAGSDLRVPWSEVKRVHAHDGARVLSIRNGWRTLFRLRCADDASYARVKAAVEVWRKER